MNPKGFTTINEAQLKTEGREIMRKIRKVFSFYVTRVTICSKDFDVLFKAVFPSFQKDCKNEISFDGKSIFRGK